MAPGPALWMVVIDSVGGDVEGAGAVPREAVLLRLGQLGFLADWTIHEWRRSDRESSSAGVSGVGSARATTKLRAPRAPREAARKGCDSRMTSVNGCAIGRERAGMRAFRGRV
jgi:hypothetical protein